MKFGIVDSDSSEDEFVHVEPIEEGYSSDEYEVVENPSRKQNISHLGRNIRAIFDDSDTDEELNARVPPGLVEPPKTSLVPLHGPPIVIAHTKPKPKPNAVPGWILAEPTVDQLLSESESNYDGWLKVAEAQAWRDGHEVADKRVNHLVQLAAQAKAELRARQRAKEAELDADLHRQFDALSIAHQKDDEDTAKRFAARENKIWDEVEEAIRIYEEKVAHAQAQAAAEARRQREAEEARIAAQERARKAAEAKVKEAKAAEAQENKERQEREAAQAAEKEKAEREEKERKEKAEVDAKRGGTAMDTWKTWVEVQQALKKDVIEVVKNERASLRQGMRLITRGVGQVVNTRESILRLTNEIHDIFSSQLPTPPTVSSPALLRDPATQEWAVAQRYIYLLSHFSKAIIKQAEAEVNAKPDAAFPLGRVIVGLLLRGHAALGDVLFARLVKKCPWVIPYYPHRRPDQPREEYEKSTGRLSDESRTVYIDRMAGIVTVYFAVLQTPLASIVQTLPGPAPTKDQLQVLFNTQLRSSASWTWLALMTQSSSGSPSSLPPAARLVTVFINILGPEFLAQYRIQGKKVLEMIRRDGVEGGKLEGDTVADKQRLKLVMDDWSQKGRIEGSKARNW